MRLARNFAAWFWTLLVFVLCWTPRQFVPEGEGPRVVFLFPYFDKVVHFVLFAGFAFLWLFAGVRRIGWVFAAGVAVAVITELGQANSIVRRDANWPDGFADTLGVLAGILTFELAGRWVPKLRPIKAPSAETP